MTMLRRSRRRATGDRSLSEDAELPVLVQCARERHGGPDDRPDRGRAGAVEKSARPGVPADAVETVAADEDEGERGRRRRARRIA